MRGRCLQSCNVIVTVTLGAQVDAGWETAVTYLKLAIETAVATITSAPTLLAIKDLVLLLCSTLGKQTGCICCVHDNHYSFPELAVQRLAMRTHSSIKMDTILDESGHGFGSIRH